MKELIKPIESYDMHLEDDFMCLESEVRSLETLCNEMLEALIKQTYAIERQILNDNPVSIVVKMAWWECKKVIEKATHKTWDTIKKEREG